MRGSARPRSAAIYRASSMPRFASMALPSNGPCARWVPPVDAAGNFRRVRSLSTPVTRTLSPLLANPLLAKACPFATTPKCAPTAPLCSAPFAPSVQAAHAIGTFQAALAKAMPPSAPSPIAPASRGTTTPGFAPTARSLLERPARQMMRGIVFGTFLPAPSNRNGSPGDPSCTTTAIRPRWRCSWS